MAEVPSAVTRSEKFMSGSADNMPTPITREEQYLKAIAEGGGGSGGGGSQYSTDKFDTGEKWVDGRTIYGKLIFAPQAYDEAQYAIGAQSDIDFVISVAGTADNRYPLCYNDNDRFICAYINTFNGTVYLRFNTDRGNWDLKALVKFVEKS